MFFLTHTHLDSLTHTLYHTLNYSPAFTTGLSVNYFLLLYVTVGDYDHTMGPVAREVALTNPFEEYLLTPNKPFLVHVQYNVS